MSERRFDPAELDGEVAGGDSRSDLAAARELEWLADQAPANASAGFTDRVAAAIAAEPLPSPAGAVVAAVRLRSSRAFLAALADAWRVAWSAGRPLAYRVQALALILVVAVALGSLGGVAAVGGLSLLRSGPGPSATLHPTVVPAVTPSPTPEPSESAEPSGSPSESPEPSETASPTSRPSASPGEASGGSDSSSPPSAQETPRPAETSRPTETPRPTAASDGTPRPSETAPPSDG